MSKKTLGQIAYEAYPRQSSKHYRHRWEEVEQWIRNAWESSAQAVADAVRAESQWQPIETAPKDGTKILVDDNGSVTMVWWDADKYARKPRPYWHSINSMRVLHDRAMNPIHWQPLPTAPNATKE